MEKKISSVDSHSYSSFHGGESHNNPSEELPKKERYQFLVEVPEWISENYLFLELLGRVLNPYCSNKRVPLFQNTALNLSYALFWKPFQKGETDKMIEYLLKRAKELKKEEKGLVHSGKAQERKEKNQQFYLIVWLLGVFYGRGIYFPEKEALTLFGMNPRLSKYFPKQKVLILASFFYKAAVGGQIVMALEDLSKLLVESKQAQQIPSVFDFSFCDAFNVGSSSVPKLGNPMHLHLSALLNRVALFHDKNFLPSLLRLGILIQDEGYRPSQLDFTMCGIKDFHYPYWWWRKRMQQEFLRGAVAAFYRAVARKNEYMGYPAVNLSLLMKQGGYQPCKADFQTFELLLPEKKDRKFFYDLGAEFFLSSFFSGNPSSVLEVGSVVETGFFQPTSTYYLACCEEEPDQFEEWLDESDRCQKAAFFYRAAITMNHGDCRGFLKIGDLVESGHYTPCEEDFDLLNRRVRGFSRKCVRYDRGKMSLEEVAVAFYIEAAAGGCEQAIGKLSEVAMNNPQRVPLGSLVDIIQARPMLALDIFEHTFLRNIIWQDPQVLKMCYLLFPEDVVHIITEKCLSYKLPSYHVIHTIINVHPDFLTYLFQRGEEFIQFLNNCASESNGAAHFLFEIYKSRKKHYAKAIFTNEALVNYIADNLSRLQEWYRFNPKRLESSLSHSLQLFKNRLSKDAINHIGLTSAYLMDQVLRAVNLKIVSEVSLGRGFVQFKKTRASLFAFVYFIFYDKLEFSEDAGKIFYDKSLVGLIFLFLSAFPLPEFRTELYERRYWCYKRCLRVRRKIASMDCQKKLWRFWGQDTVPLRLRAGSYKQVTRGIRELHDKNEDRMSRLLTGEGMPLLVEEEIHFVNEELQEAELRLGL